MADFKTGDVVRVAPLKGPWMIVESCEQGSASCFWFDKTDAGHREKFPMALLEVRKSDVPGISGFIGARHSKE